MESSMRTLVIVHIPNGARLADENEKQAALDTMARFSSNAPHWRPEYVPEFSTLDCERFQRVCGVILDETRLHVPPIVEIESLEKSIRAFENWQGGL